MARIKVNVSCNVVTDNDSKGYYRNDGTVAPRVTIPSLRASLTVYEAQILAKHLMEAAELAARIAEEQDKARGVK